MGRSSADERTFSFGARVVQAASTSPSGYCPGHSLTEFARFQKTSVIPAAYGPSRIAPADALPDVVERLVSRRQFRPDDDDVLIVRERVPRVNPRAQFPQPWRYRVTARGAIEQQTFTSFPSAPPKRSRLPQRGTAASSTSKTACRRYSATTVADRNRSGGVGSRVSDRDVLPALNCVIDELVRD
jgi:hypothetical protein